MNSPTPKFQRGFPLTRRELFYRGSLGFVSAAAFSLQIFLTPLVM